MSFPDAPARPTTATSADNPLVRWHRAARAWGQQHAATLRDEDAETSARIVSGLVVAAIATVAFLATGAGALLAYFAILIPLTPSGSDLRRVQDENPSVVLTADGEQIAEYQRLNREWIGIDSMSASVIDALISTEDVRFYRHGGVDWKRIVGAGLRTASGDMQGGSTITQQLARNLYPDEIGRQVSISRKAREIVTAFKIERVYEKDEILELYLNTVPFLYNAFGIEMAARTYFNKPAIYLDTLEAATLIGMLKGTSLYNPVRNPERATERRNVVLGQMAKAGHLTPGQRQTLAAKPLMLDFQRQPAHQSGAPHFTEYVREQMIEWADRSGYNLYGDGLVIHTTLDSRLQAAAQAAAEQYGTSLQNVADYEWSQRSGRLLSSNFGAYDGATGSPFAYFFQTDAGADVIRETRRFESMREAGADAAQALADLRGNAEFLDSLRAVKGRVEVSFTAMDPANGHVLAWIGSRDYVTNAFDHVADAERQAGSTFKPFVYAQAIRDGYSPDDVFIDGEVEIRVGRNQVWRPSNAGGGVSNRPVTLRTGLAQSMNTITAQVMEATGPEKVARLARDMGVRDSELEAVPSLALGTSDVSLLEMTTAYSTFASGGTYRAPVAVTHITNAAGRTIQRFDGAETESVLDANTAALVVDMLRGVVDSGTGRRARGLGVRGDVAGKTGTTQNSADGWFMLMHPDLVGGAWVGFDDPRVTFRTDYWGQGAHNALYIVADVFRQAQGEGLVDTGNRFPAPRRVPPPVRTAGLIAQMNDTLGTSTDTLAVPPTDLSRIDSLLARGDRIDAGEEAAEAAEQAEDQRPESQQPARRAPMPVTPPSAEQLRRELAEQQSGGNGGNGGNL